MELADPSFWYSFNHFTTIAAIWWDKVYNKLRKSLIHSNKENAIEC